MGVPCLMGTEFQFGMRESSGNGGRCWLHNSVKVLNATELNTSMVKMINSMLCIFFHNKKKKINKNTQDNYFTEALTVKKLPCCRENIPLF